MSKQIPMTHKFTMSCYRYPKHSNFGPCLNECRSKLILNKCGCRMTWMKGDFPICSLYQTMTCVDMILYKGLTTFETNTSCNCKPKCFRTEYETSVTTSAMSSNMANSIMLLVSPPGDLAKIGRIQDWAYLDKRNRRYTDKLYSIGRFLNQIHDVTEVQISDILWSHLELLHRLTGMHYLNMNATNVSIAIENATNLIRKLYLQHLEIRTGFSKSFFYTETNKSNISNGDDEIIDDFYARCANDILRHNGSYMKEFYFQTQTKIESLLALTYEVDNIIFYITNNLSRVTDLSDGFEKIGTESLFEKFHDLKQSYSSMYNMYIELNTQVHTDKVLLNTKDWGNAQNGNEDFQQQNYIQLNIYFASLSTARFEQFEPDSLTSLICDLGGNIGLWLGGSILTLFEIIDISFNIFNPPGFKKIGVFKAKNSVNE